MSTEEHVSSPFAQNFSQDLENARVLIEESPWKDNPQKYRKVAEGILKRILTMDPENQSAKLLLIKAEAPAPAAKVEAPLRLIKTEPQVREAPSRPGTSLDLSFVVPSAAPQRDKGNKEEKRQKTERVKNQDFGPPRLLVGFAALGAISGVVLLVTHWNTFTLQYSPKVPIVPAAVEASAATSKVDPASSTNSAFVGPLQVSPPVTPAPVPPVTPAPALTPVAAPVQAPPPRQAPVAQTSTAPPPATVVKSNVPPVAPIQTGTLAVSSPTTADIYLGDQLLGSAPTTLVLPAGNQTLEYRHQDQRKVLTYVIKPNETTTATVTFEVSVQINARPWAQVFIDGPQRQPLGQTPLSDVRVPLGSLLIFENPNFPGKNYRVTGKETEIRMTFP